MPPIAIASYGSTTSLRTGPSVLIRQTRSHGTPAQFVLIYLGRWDAALEANAMAIKLAPSAPDLYDMPSLAHEYDRTPGRSIDRLSTGARARSGQPWMGPAHGVRSALLLGQAEQAIPPCEKARGLYRMT